MGDLHLPIGWGTIPWETIFDGMSFLKGTIANIELPGRYYDEAAACVARVRRFTGLAG